MAITLIRKITDEGPSNLMFKTEFIHVQEGITEELEERLTGTAVLVDDDLKPLSVPAYYHIATDEEEFHKDLRAKAAERKQLITSHSTDPEWNPEGYSKNLGDVD